MEVNAQIFPESEIKVPTIDEEPHLLISPVRKMYLDYIKRILYKNYKARNAQKTPDCIEKILRLAEIIELKAAAQSMMVPMYRKQITTMISVIKHYTELNQPYPDSYIDVPKSKSKVDKATQTDIVQNIINCDNPSIMNSNLNICDNFKLDGFIDHSISDNIDLQMQQLFNGNSPNDIFGDQMNKTQLNFIMTEIENFGKSEESELQLQQGVMNEEALEPISACNNVQNTLVKNVGSQIAPNCSRWFCEEYFQKKMLSEKLSQISDYSIKLHKKVKEKYIDLFGYESEDEEIMQSPITTSTFRRSCRNRIEPWLKNHMGRFFIQYRVSSHLYKPLLKHLIYKLIQINQYPSDYEVYVFVKEYFEQHGLKKIRCKADF